MITVPAHRVKQFGVEFYQTSFTSGDIQKLVKFEVLNDSAVGEVEKRRKSGKATAINWELLENRIGRSEAAFQRPMIRKKIRELVQYYLDCQEARNLPAILGAVIMIAEKRLKFSPAGKNPNLGMLQISEESGILRCLDGQHRLLALSAQTEKDVDIMVDLFSNIEKLGGRDRFKGFEQSGKRFFLNYFKAILALFPKAWAGRKYSIKTGAALRAFIRISPDVIARSKELKNDSFDYFGIREAIKPWGERIGEGRFETEGEWRRKLAGGTRGTVELLTREFREALKVT